MARCTAPVRGHSSASAAENCPACRGRYGRYSGTAATGRTRPHLTPRRGKRGRPKQRRRFRPQRKAALVGSRFVRVVHACRSSGTHTSPQQRRKTGQICLTFGTSSSAMRGTTGRGPPRSCTICLSHVVSPSGSARRTLASACRCFAPSTRAWRTRELGLCW